MSTLWYYAHDEKKLGPFSQRELKEMAVSGTIQPMDTVWREGVEKGVLASRVRYLFVGAAVKSAPTIAGPLLAAAAFASPPVEAAAPPANPSPEIVVNTSLVPLESYTPKPQPKAPEKPSRRGRAIALKGADILSQDGTNARYRRKCSECGHNDSASHMIVLSNKLIKENFFCPKCHKRRDVAIQCQS